MPTPCDIALADEIVASINAQWAGQIVAERTWLPDWKVKSELDLLAVAVQPGTEPTGELTERDQVWEVWPIDVGFARRLTLHTRAEIDGLVSLVDEVREFLQLAEITDDDGRHFQGLGFEFLARFDPTLLDRQVVDADVVYGGAFLSLCRFPFRRLD